MSTIMNISEDYYCPISGELMKNPYLAKDSHSYEYDSIVRWLETKSVSPMTREPMTKGDLIKNLELKNRIDKIRASVNQEQLIIKSKVYSDENREFIDNLDKIELKAFNKDNYIIVSSLVPNVENRPPVDIVLCLDISGSMGTDAPVKGDDGSSTSYGINVLSLTISAAKTILKTLNSKDNISIVTYSCYAKVLFSDIDCSEENKIKVETELDNLVPTGTTNMWDGIKTSLDILRNNSPKDKLKVIKLFTDGLPSTEPNRGYGPEIQKYFKTNDFKCMINCYGFGYSLKSEILNDISNVSGGDGFSYIPDSSLLGNMFIHGITNFFTTAATYVPGKIVFTDGTDETFEINSLKFGQTKNLVFESDKQVSHVELIINDNIIKSELSDISDDKFNEQFYRYKAYKILDKCISLKKFNNDEFKKIIDNLILEIKSIKSNEYIQNILFDLEGQVREALNMTTQGQKEDWFTKWGIHYLRSLKTAYDNEVCNNFKDKGVSNFTGELFEKIRDEVSDIFDNMPPPKRTEITTYGSTGMRGGGGLIIGSATTHQPLPTMASYNVPSGGCCAKGSRIRMEDNSFKKVENIKKGDEVITVDIRNGIQYFQSGIIECVIVTKCENNVENMVTIYGYDDIKLNITPYHPIIGFNSNSTWNYPININQPKIIDCEDMYTFIINNRQSVLVEDFVFATFGHNLKEDIIYHKYLGSEKVIDDLKNIIGYGKGKIILTKDIFQRNINGEINFIGKHFKLNFINNLYYANL
jgi:hypothetical protein